MESFCKIPKAKPTAKLAFCLSVFFSSTCIICRKPDGAQQVVSHAFRAD